MSSSESGSSLDESSSEDSSSLLARPVFLKKSKQPAAKTSPAPNLAIAKAEFHSLLDAKEAKISEFGDVDDTDNIDPDAEYNSWKLRERHRRQRDRVRLEQLETEKEDILRRQRDRTQTGHVDGEEPDQLPELQAAPKGLGSFYADGLDQMLLKRDYGEVEDLGDHSRPTRFRQ